MSDIMKIRAVLTSAGFENNVVEQYFLEMAGKPSEELRALWIPTAAIDDDAVAMLPKCMNDLLGAGLLHENIQTYDLDRKMTSDELAEYDVIYVCGGNCRHLLDRMHGVGFDKLLDDFFDGGGVYIGVSAGSCVCGGDFEDGLGFVPCSIGVHCKEGTLMGTLDFDMYDHCDLTDRQAIVIQGGEVFIVE